MQDDIEKAFQDELKDHAFNQEVMRTGLEIAYIDIDFKAGWEAHAARSGWVAIEDIDDALRDGHHVSLGWWLFPTKEWQVEHRCEWDSGRGAWFDYDGNEVTGAKFAYRPVRTPPPPQSKGGE